MIEYIGVTAMTEIKDLFVPDKSYALVILTRLTLTDRPARKANSFSIRQNRAHKGNITLQYSLSSNNY